MLATAGFIGALMSLTRADIVYSLVIIWAVIGIALKHSTVPLVSTAAWITVVFILVLMLFGISRSRRQFDHRID